jgi:hypothetical protein
LPWTESRSREEWLAEVQRRGSRIRRRRRIGVGLVGALALVLPVSLTATALRNGPQRAVELSGAGPAPERVVDGDRAPGADAPSQPSAPGEPVTTTTVSEPPAETVPRRLVPETTVRAFIAPASPGSVPPGDDPVVRSTTTVPPVPGTVSSILPPNQSTPGTSSAASATPAASATSSLPPCAAEALQIDVVPSKATFALGETVRGTFFVQTYKATDCVVSMPASFRIENVTTGAVVASVSSTTDGPNPVRADGKMYTSTFAWDQQDCSGAVCAPVPPALYQAVAQWTDGGPYRGWGEFRIAG